MDEHERLTSREPINVLLNPYNNLLHKLLETTSDPVYYRTLNDQHVQLPPALGQHTTFLIHVLFGL